jgi:PAS domain-containing protein
MLIPPDRLGEEDMILQRVRMGERVEDFETIRRRKDGTIVDASITVSPIRHESGAIVGASKIARNISDRKRTERELKELQRRLLGLAVASASILGSPDIDTVLTATIDVARDVFSSDGYAVWRSDEKGTWRIVRSFGVSDEFAARVIVAGGERSGAGGSRPVLSEPRVFQDVETDSMVGSMRDAYRREGIASMILFPLLIHEEHRGTMVFYSRRPHGYRDVDVQVGTALANLVAAALTTAELYEAQRTAREAADHARKQAAFLAEAGTVLSSSLDYVRQRRVRPGVFGGGRAGWPGARRARVAGRGERPLIRARQRGEPSEG